MTSMTWPSKTCPFDSISVDVMPCTHAERLGLQTIRAKGGKHSTLHPQKVPAVIATAMMTNRWFVIPANRQIQVRTTARVIVTTHSKLKLQRNV